MNKNYVLATDLDGTFLHGTDRERYQLYSFLKANRFCISVIFVTGRTLQLVEELYSSGFDFIPDYVIADHGTVIVRGGSHLPVEPLQSNVIQRWNESDHRGLFELLKRENTISVQPFYPPYRHALYYHCESTKDDLLPKIKALGFECVVSSGVYLDILPQKFNKGITLLHLLDQLQMDRNNVITAGDSLNDLPLFKTNLASIIVGNAEQDLLPHVKDMDNVYLSRYRGVSGILDGLYHFWG